MTTIFKLCHFCACEVVNGDYSGRAFWDLSEDEESARDQAIERMGRAVHVGTDDCRFTCDVCQDEHGVIDYEEAEIFERDDFKS